jgi:hypothetical protein
MALPVDTTGEGADCSAEEYKEMVDSMMAAKAAAADPLALETLAAHLPCTLRHQTSPWRPLTLT